MIPVYNEAARIEETLRTIAGYLDEQAYESEVIVVDDGSTDGTASILTEFSRSSFIHVLRHHPNLGKGASVRKGVLEARGRHVFFMDADLSVPIDELTGALAAMSGGDVSILIGSRKIAGARIERRQPLLRECLGHGFTWIARLLLWRTIVDFTCGFKGFRRDEARVLFLLQQCDDWAFDAEILYLARLLGKPVHQHPVRWSHQENSRVRFPRDVWWTLVALIRIRLRGRRLVRNQAAQANIVGPVAET